MGAGKWGRRVHGARKAWARRHSSAGWQACYSRQRQAGSARQAVPGRRAACAVPARRSPAAACTPAACSAAWASRRPRFAPTPHHHRGGRPSSPAAPPAAPHAVPHASAATQKNPGRGRCARPGQGARPTLPRCCWGRAATRGSGCRQGRAATRPRCSRSCQTGHRRCQPPATPPRSAATAGCRSAPASAGTHAAGSACTGSSRRGARLAGGTRHAGGGRRRFQQGGGNS